MKRIFFPYTEWEDFKNGMYDISKKDNEEYLIQKSILLLKDNEEFFNTSIKLLNEWNISSDVNLSNLTCNRKAWIGQAACCYNHNCPEILTRKAWSLLSDKERISANNVAEKIIKTYEYEAKNKRLHKRLGKQMLFKWDS